MEDHRVTGSERKLGIGVIGAGGIAHYAHFPNLVKNPRVNLVAVADIDRARAEAAAETYGFAHHYADYEDVIANPEVEAVIVTSWPTAHAGPVIAAAEAGKHILCEKPIATTLEDADAMVTAAGTGFRIAGDHLAELVQRLPGLLLALSGARFVAS